MISGIDHLVILVPNLDQGIDDYTKLGFQVARGGVHPGGTHNALIGFADGSYLELIAFQQPEQPSRHRWYRFLGQGGGLIDFALRCDDVDAAAAALRESGLEYQVNPGARTTPDGTQLAWRSAQPTADRSGDLPFLIQDVTPRQHRVPGGDSARHPNGVVGLRALVVASRDVIEAARDFSAILGVSSAPRSEEHEGQRTVRFSAGAQEIILAQPTVPDSPLAERIQRRGDGPFEALFDAAGISESHAIPPQEADGARLVLVPVRL